MSITVGPGRHLGKRSFRRALFVYLIAACCIGITFNLVGNSVDRSQNGTSLQRIELDAVGVTCANPNLRGTNISDEPAVDESNPLARRFPPTSLSLTGTLTDARGTPLKNVTFRLLEYPFRIDANARYRKQMAIEAGDSPSRAERRSNPYQVELVRQLGKDYSTDESGTFLIEGAVKIDRQYLSAGLLVYVPSQIAIRAFTPTEGGGTYWGEIGWTHEHAYGNQIVLGEVVLDQPRRIEIEFDGESEPFDVRVWAGIPGTEIPDFQYLLNARRLAGNASQHSRSNGVKLSHSQGVRRLLDPLITPAWVRIEENFGIPVEPAWPLQQRAPQEVRVFRKQTHDFFVDEWVRYLTISRPGYFDEIVSIRGERKHVVSFEESSDVMVVVLDSRGMPIQDETVRLYECSVDHERFRALSTDINGTVRFNAVSTRNPTIEVGEVWKQIRVGEIGGGKLMRMEIQLERFDAGSSTSEDF